MLLILDGDPLTDEGSLLSVDGVVGVGVSTVEATLSSSDVSSKSKPVCFLLNLVLPDKEILEAMVLTAFTKDLLGERLDILKK